MFAEFSLKTGIRGFSFAHFAKTKVEKCLWYLIIIVCVIMTFWDVTETVKLYMSFPTGTKVTLVENSTLSFGSPTFCLPFKNSLENLAHLQHAKPEDITTFLDKYVDYLTYDNKTIPIASNDSVMFLSLSLAVLSSINRGLYYTLPRFPDYDYTWGFIRYIDDSKLLLEGELQVATAAKWFKENHISFTKLLQTAGDLMCRMSTVRMSVLYTRNVSKPVCDSSKITFIGQQMANPIGDFVCFKLPAEYFNFKYTADVTLFNYEIPQNFRSSNNQFVDSASMDFSSEIVVLPRVPNIMWLGSGQHLHVQISFSAHFKVINHSYKPCSTTITWASCAMECRHNFIRKFCKCQEISVSSLKSQNETTTLPECTIELLSPTTNETAATNCLSIRQDHNPDKICMQKCLKSCESSIFLFFFQPVSGGQNPNRTELTLIVDPYSYAQFEEIFILSTKQFLGSLGGNLSLYLGASFLVLFHTISFWISALIQKLFQLR